MDNPSEVWVLSDLLPLYAVSDAGRIKRIAHIRKSKWPVDVPLKGTVKGGYPAIVARVNGRQRQFYIHRLVAHAFLGPAPKGCEVAHLDGNPLNSRLDNLAYVTHAENEFHKIEHGTSNSGERNGQAKLSQDDVLKILREPNYRGAVSDLSKRFNVTTATISEIRNGKKWQTALTQIRSGQ